MKREEAKKRIEKLKKVINYHRYLYHVLNRQEISDAALDSLKHELYKLEQRFPNLITPDSPTQRVGGRPLKGFKKVRHKIPMLSIEDIFSEKELGDWQNYLTRLIPSGKFDHFREKRGIKVLKREAFHGSYLSEEKARFSSGARGSYLSVSESKVLKREAFHGSYFAELKIDGFAVTLVYKNNVLEYGATRGTGTLGEDVTQNLKTIESIPLKIDIHSPLKQNAKLPKEIKERLIKTINQGIIEIRGEVYMEKHDFLELNKQILKKGGKTFANPRNLAAGSIRQLDPKLASSRPLKFLAYDIVTDFGQKTHSQEHKILSILGFKTDPGKECKNLTEVMDYYAKIVKKREKFPFQIDGVVVSVDSNQLFEKLAVVGKSPRGVRALKFPPKQATTIVKDIKLQIGRTGALTPVAILKPVEIDGVTISRATLHNEDEIRKLGVRIGDTVIVERAGDVIPVVSEVLPDLRTGKERKFKMPRICPSCGTRLVKPEKEVIWRCLNPKCFVRKKKYFYHFVSKGAFDIVSLGPKIVDKLLDRGLISDPADLFNLKEGDISALEGFAEKSAQNLISAIRLKKKITLPKFISALGIRNVGEETAHLLAEKFISLENLIKTSLFDLERIRDIGPIVAQSIYDFFQNKKNLEFIRKLKTVGVKIQATSDRQPSSALAMEGEQDTRLKGLSFVLTGNLKTMTRPKAKEKIRFLGGKTSKSVSKMTDYLVVGSDPGSKLNKAKKIGTKIIKEKEFLELIK